MTPSIPGSAIFGTVLREGTFSFQNEMGPIWIGFNHIQHGYIIMVNSIFARLSHDVPCLPVSVLGHMLEPFASSKHEKEAKHQK